MANKLPFDRIQKRQMELHSKQQSFPVMAMLENIRSLYNVGSMFRTADGAGLQKLYLTGYTGTPPRKEIEKTALGSTGNIPWEHHNNSVDLALSLKKRGIKLVLFEHTYESVSFETYSYEYPSCLVFGNEVEGVTSELCELADTSLTIPMYGTKESLNVAVAFGVAVYNAVLQYSMKEY